MAAKKTKKPKPPKKVQTRDAPDKATIKSRVDLSALIGTKAVQSPIWQAKSELSDAGKKLIQAGLDLDAADKAAAKADLEAINAHTTRDTAEVEWNGLYDVYAALVKQNAPKPADVAALALSVLERNKHGLEIPLGLTAVFDAKASQVDIKVKPAPGLQHVEIEYSNNSADPNSWKRVKGNGLKRKITGLSAGTYWVRACSVRAEDESDYTTPIAVVVK
jgi:hypothetical protein